MANWNTLKKGTRVELGLLQIDIAGHSKFQDSDRILKLMKGLFRKQIEGIALSREGKLFNWAGDGGSFMFLTGEGEGFDDLVFSAIQMLESLPAINNEISIRTGFTDTISVRISCDSGMATYDNDPSLITGDFINKFLKSEREIGLTNTASITERVWRQLLPELKKKFHEFKYLDKVENKIYNYGGKRRQTEVLKSLCNVDDKGNPIDEPMQVSVIAFQGDSLIDLSKIAYEDVLVKGVKNVANLNLLTLKNAQLCYKHFKAENNRSTESYLRECSFENRRFLEEILNEMSCEERTQVNVLLNRIPLHYINRILMELKHLTEQIIQTESFLQTSAQASADCESSSSYKDSNYGHGHTYDNRTKYFLEQLENFAQRDGQSQYGEPDPVEPFKGGELLLFYNCAALGYKHIIGDGTLLDQVFAGNLTINKVIGGVAEPSVKMRVFEMMNGVYQEIGEQRT